MPTAGSDPAHVVTGGEGFTNVVTGGEGVAYAAWGPAPYIGTLCIILTRGETLATN
eukprot:CAMPEP_0194496434 /NCGR_PEP_ID=MMETSP0253-20130528/13704_1 /TAXON_ID=2966 /ORGANISM="Noctiluca scintillans" /LENGTH=55 /DNA_ID=CAMNT_0039337825 /DNA_START=230 /DNA_END=397 /DNA_ORIENTATION=+